VNAYELLEDGNYIKCELNGDSEPFNIHERFFDVTLEEVMATKLFVETQPEETPLIEGFITLLESEA
jgi:polyphosphate kinase